MISFIVVAVLFHVSGCAATPEEAFDDEPMLYVATRGGSKFNSEKGRQLDEQRRSALDKNFVRFGRGGGQNIFQPEDVEYDLRDDLDYVDEFTRPTRSQDKSDNFIRFGRGKSDFVRFGRNPYQYMRETRGNAQNFLRFGRSVTKSEPKERSKRDVYDKYSPLFKRNDKSSNFLRFGKGGNDNFMRFGRNQDKTDEANDPTPTEAFAKGVSNLIHEQRQSRSYPFSTKLLQNPLVLRFLAQLNEELNQRYQ